MVEEILKILKILSGLGGAYLLYKEVYIAHDFEKYRSFMQSESWERLKEFSFLYQQSHRDFYKKYALSGLSSILPNLNEESIFNKPENFIDSLTDQEIEDKLSKSVLQLENGNIPLKNLPALIERHEQVSSEGGMKKRKNLLKLGILLIFLSASIDILLIILEN